jgi:hypothetical protein
MTITFYGWSTSPCRGAMTFLVAVTSLRVLPGPIPPPQQAGESPAIYGEIPGRLPGLKFLRTLWVASLAGGPFHYTARELRDAHFDLKIGPEVFDEVSAELGRTLDHFSVPEREKVEVLASFNGWKDEVTAGSKPGAINLASLALSRNQAASPP